MWPPCSTTRKSVLTTDVPTYGPRYRAPSRWGLALIIRILLSLKGASAESLGQSWGSVNDENESALDRQLAPRCPVVSTDFSGSVYRV